MKLLYLTEDQFPPFRADVVELFAKQMSKKGHQIDWLMQRGESSIKKSSVTIWNNNRVYLTVYNKTGGFVGRVINNILGVLGDFKVVTLAFKERYDVIQVRDKYLASIVAILAARLTHTKFVYWMSYPFSESKLYLAKEGYTRYPRILWVKGHLNKLLLYKIIMPLADHVFVQSEQMKKDVIAEGINPIKLTAVPMGICKEIILDSNDARAPNQESPVLLYLGIILRIRQLDMLVRVLKKVKKKYPNATLLYVGEGQNPEDRQAVEDEVKRQELENSVTITGFQSMEKAWEYVKQVDICLSPFYPIPVLRSTSPTKLIEYMAMAKCIVANEHPEQCQVLAESGVGQCVPWGEDSFADAVCNLLDNPEDAKQNASRGPDWVRKHRSYDVIADFVESEYVKLLE